MPFYYLSLQKAPPSTCTYDDRLLVSPTILNDLREEVYEPAIADEEGGDDGSVRIVMTWLAESAQQSLVRVGIPTYLDWQTAAQAYKSVEIVVPSRRAIGSLTKSLRLALYVERRHSPDSLEPWQYDLFRESSADDLTFVPVLSAPVSLKGNNVDASLTLSGHRQRELCLGPGLTLHMEEHAGFDLEGHLWDAAAHLVRWLATSVALTQITAYKAARILELGAGTGLVSIALAVLLSQRVSSHKRISITATDLQSALALLQRNIDANRHLVSPHVSPHVSITSRTLDWEQAARSDEGAFDFIFISDCTYNPAYFAALSRAIRTCLSAKGQCWLAKKHRHVDEDALFGHLERARLHHHLVCGDEPRLAVNSEHAYVGWAIYAIAHVKG